MPIYEYRCGGCGRTLEKIQKLSDPPLTRCPDCSGTLTKLVSVAAFQLKGSGWYADGYAPKAAAKGADGKGAAPEGGKGPDKDAKPEPRKAAAGGCGSGCGCH